MEVDPAAATEAGAAGAAVPELAPGATVGKYRLDRVLGAGGMGVVWAAFDPDLERPVAIKVLRAIDSGATLRTRLLREARAMARLKHPNILTVYEVGTDRNRDYIAMELIDGADLDAWLKTKPPRADIVAALLAAGRGLAAAHDAGLIHRDLKPHNLLRGRDGSVYVTDFGLARGQLDDGVEVVQAPGERLATARPLDSVLDSPLTQTGVMIGTPAYMAPEQFAGRAPDPRSDQFAFCVTAWEALTGARPFAGKNLDELRAAGLAGVTGDGGLPPRVRHVLVRGLAVDPAQRWPELRVLLRELEASFAPADGGSQKPAGSRRRVVVLGGLIAAGAVLALFSGERSRWTDDAVDVERVTGPRAGCEPAGDALGEAWSSRRKKAVMARHQGELELLAVTAMLDDVGQKWMRAYDAACALPESGARHERLACLFGARDEVAEMTSELVNDDSTVSVAALVGLTMAVDGCRH